MNPEQSNQPSRASQPPISYKPRHRVVIPEALLIGLGITLPPGPGGILLAAGVMLVGFSIMYKVLQDGRGAADKRPALVRAFIFLSTLGIAFVIFIVFAYAALIADLYRNPPDS